MRTFGALIFTLTALAASTVTAAQAADVPPAAPQLPPGAKIASLEAFPTTIELTGPFAYRQLLVTAVLDSGERVDATRLVAATASAPLVDVNDRGLIRPQAEGDAQLVCELAGHRIEIPLRVTGLASPADVSFIRDVMPNMAKMGCNAGTCHGAAKGKNGFKLSLRGYDAAFDFRALTDDLAGRRYNRAAPDQSLMLLKASGSVPHTGGMLTRPGEPRYEMLRRWITSGVKFDAAAPRVQSIAVYPADVTLGLPGMTQQLAVLATYADGSTRDVTAEAFLETSLADVLKVDPQGLATAVRRGEAAVLARYEGAYAVARATVMGDRSGFVWSDRPANNYIDELVYAKLKKLKIQPSGLAADAEFLRRVSLDLTGLPPTPDEVRAFLADPRDTRVKRDELIDRLIGSPAFIEYWTNKWADLLQVNRDLTSLEVAEATRKWIRQAVADNMPYDRFVHTVLSASGSTRENPATAYYQVLRTPETAVENSTQLFLGVRFNCNKCHDHPFERWTQKQYYELAAYFAQVKREIAPGSQEAPGRGGNQPEDKRGVVEVIGDASTGEEKYLSTGEVARPSFPFQHADMPPPELPRREQFARWTTSPRNPYFAMSYVNRVWSYLNGVGIIEPVDDVRAGNPPSNPELLQRLTDDFIAGGFNTRELMRLICKSRVYQHAIATNASNADDETNYSHALARRLPAEVLFDALHSVTGSASRLPGAAPGARAVELVDSQVKSPDNFLDLFGRPPRESACECERASNISLAQTLSLVNGPTVAEAINDPGSSLAKLVAAEPDDGKLVEELFLRVLCRPPTAAESEAACAALNPAYFDADDAQLTAQLRNYVAALDVRQAVWEELHSKAVVWHEATPVAATAEGAALKIEGNVVIAGGDNPDKTKYTVTIDTPLTGITGIRLEALADPSLPASGPGRATNGNFVLNELTVTAAPLPAEPATAAQPVVLQNAQADFSQGSYDVAGAIDGKPESGWAVAPQFGQPHTAAFETAVDLAHPGGTRLVVTLDQHFGGQHTIGRFRLALATSPRPVKLASELPGEIAAIAVLSRAERSADQQAQLTAYFRGLDPKHARLHAAAAGYEHWRAEKRVVGAQDVAWALINSPAFLFNR